MGTTENFGQAWDDARKSALVAQIVSGKLSVKDACERHQLSPETIQDWVRVFRRTTLQALDDHLRQTFLIQGADAGALGSAEYTGTLADIPLSDLIQTFQMGAKDGVIAVTCAGRRSRIWCQRGEIVDAESGRLRGETAAYRVLAFDSGQVFADFRGEPRERTIDVPGNVLLLEAARRKDEGARVIERLGGLRSVYRASASEPARANGAERALLASCDGQRELSAVLDQSELGDLETLNALLALSERGDLVRESATLAPVGPVALAVREPPRAILSPDMLGSVVSLSPLAVSDRPARRARRGPPLALLGAALALAGIVWGFARSRSTRQPASAAASTQSQRGALPAATPDTYEIDTVAEPANAELWLDGSSAGVGRLRRELLRDGQAHSLRVAADGYAPTTLLFADAPPPNHIRLEQLSAPAPREAVRMEPAPAPLPAPVPVPRARRPRHVERAATPPADAAPPSPPRVQIIEPTTPVVRIIE